MTTSELLRRCQNIIVLSPLLLTSLFLYFSQPVLAASIFSATGPQIYITPDNPDIGYLVDVYITAPDSCSQNTNFDPGLGFRNPDNLNTLSCKSISSSCSTPSPKDDGNKCWWQYSCVAFRISQDLSTPFIAQFTASSNSQCSSQASYTIYSPPQCQKGDLSVVTDSTGTYNNNLISQNLNDDKRLAQANAIAAWPRELYSNTELSLSEELPKVAVQMSFFANLLCSVGTILNLPGFCPVDVNLANQKTSFFADLATTHTRLKTPTSLKVPSESSSCSLSDYINDDGTLKKVDYSATGNQDIYNIDRYSNTGMLNSPEVEGYSPDQQNMNGSINRTVVSGENRPPDINCDQLKQINYYYPPGYEPPFYAIYGCEGDIHTTLTNTSTPTNTLTIAKSSNTGTVSVGQNIEFTIKVASNALPDSKVLIQDRIPANTAFVSADNGGVLNGNTVEWNLTAKKSTTTIDRSYIPPRYEPAPPGFGRPLQRITVTADQLKKELDKYSPSYSKYAQAIYDLGVKNNVDPAFFMAIWWNESHYNTVGGRENNPGSIVYSHDGNLGGMTRGVYAAGRYWAYWPTFEKGIEAVFLLISKTYYPRGQTDTWTVHSGFRETDTFEQYHCRCDIGGSLIKTWNDYVSFYYNWIAVMDRISGGSYYSIDQTLKLIVKVDTDNVWISNQAQGSATGLSNITSNSVQVQVGSAPIP